jgi:hypothetical protein
LIYSIAVAPPRECPRAYHVLANAWQVYGACQDQLRWPSAPQSHVGRRPHVATSFLACFPQRPCLTTRSSQNLTGATSARTNGAKTLRNALRHPLRRRLEAQRQGHLICEDCHPVQLGVSLFVRVLATADCVNNLALHSNPKSAPRRADNGEDSVKRGDTAKTRTSSYSTYLQQFTKKLR